MEKIDDALQYIRENQQRLGALAGQHRTQASIPVHTLKPIPWTGSVAAVDSGFLASRMHGVDLVVARAAAVNFIYRNSKLETVFYFPSKTPDPVLDVQIGLEENEANVFKQLFRLGQELTCAIETIQAFQPALLLLDGSLLPLPADRPPKESVLHPLYVQLRARYAQLYEITQTHAVQLAGVVKDTRSKRWVKTLGLPGTISDALFLDRYLQAGERTASQSCAEGEDPLARNLRVFYMKITSRDIPLRVEFLPGSEKASPAQPIAENELADVLYTLSAASKTHGYPPPLTEADLRAMLDRKELERVERTFQMHLPLLHALRRNERPFR